MRRLLYCFCGILLLLTVSRAGSHPADLIVTLKAGQGIGNLNRENGTQTIGRIENTSIYLLRIDEDDDDAEKVLKKIKRDKRVESAEFNTRIRLSAGAVPSNLSASLVQSAMDLLDGNARTTFYGTNVLRAYADQPALDLTRINQVRTLSAGAATRVAYIDTGVDPDHPALKPWVEAGVDLVRGRSASEMDGLGQSMMDLLEQSCMDVLDGRFDFILNRLAGASSFPGAFGHGTMVAGLIHIAAPQARIYPIKAFDAAGTTSMFLLVRGVYAAIDADADVLNMSFSTQEDSEAFHKAVDVARAAAIQLVAAVGNEGRDAQGRYPAGYTGVYGVAATDLDDKVASFSNYGKDVSVTAPGAFVVSTAPGGHYAIGWGTSFSAPLVAGSMALLASTRARGQSDGTLVINNADSVDAKNPGFEKKLGKGRINLQRAFKVNR